MVLRAIVAMVAATSLLVSVPQAEAGALEDCGQRVIRDWYSGGRVDKVYPLPCYREAIRALPDDVMQYTDAGAAIERALESARHRMAKAERITDAAAAVPARPVTKRPTSPAAPPPGARAAAGPANPRLAAGPAHSAHDPGLPYPLIALGALSAVLLASGVAAGLARRGR